MKHQTDSRSNMANFSAKILHFVTSWKIVNSSANSSAMELDSIPKGIYKCWSEKHDRFWITVWYVLRKQDYRPGSVITTEEPDITVWSKPEVNNLCYNWPTDPKQQWWFGSTGSSSAVSGWEQGSSIQWQGNTWHNTVSVMQRPALDQSPLIWPTVAQRFPKVVQLRGWGEGKKQTWH